MFVLNRCFDDIANSIFSNRSLSLSFSLLLCRISVRECAAIVSYISIAKASVHTRVKENLNKKLHAYKIHFWYILCNWQSIYINAFVRIKGLILLIPSPLTLHTIKKKRPYTFFSVRWRLGWKKKTHNRGALRTGKMRISLATSNIFVHTIGS